MEHEAHTRVERPVATVYNQWTQFESFPAFMQGVNKVTQLDDSDHPLGRRDRWRRAGVHRRDHRAAS